MLFQKGTITAFPTDTSFGLGVRCDDKEGLQKLQELKQRPEGKFFSLMVRDEAMLNVYADSLRQLENLRTWELKNWEEWFKQKPRTAIFKPTEKLPRSPYWPSDGVAFRICPCEHLKAFIEVPITATSANISGQDSIFSVNNIRSQFGEAVICDETILELPEKAPSEIWDFTGLEPLKIR